MCGAGGRASRRRRVRLFAGLPSGGIGKVAQFPLGPLLVGYEPVDLLQACDRFGPLASERGPESHELTNCDP